jgi:hypothetical protein
VLSLGGGKYIKSKKYGRASKKAAAATAAAVTGPVSYAVDLDTAAVILEESALVAAPMAPSPSAGAGAGVGAAGAGNKDVALLQVNACADCDESDATSPPSHLHH